MSEYDVSSGRSPRYPRFSLPAAIEYAKRLYDGAHRSSIDTLTAYKVMGFAGKSGASASALGSVRQFGLIENIKGGLRVSDLGLRILQPSSAEEYSDAMAKAANEPLVFKKISDQFEQVPRSDEPIRSFLIRSLEFSKSGADDCIAAFRQTMSSLEEGRSGHASPSEDLSSYMAEVKKEVVIDGGAMADTKMDFLLTKNCSAEVKFSGELNSVAVERLIKHLNLLREVWES